MLVRIANSLHLAAFVRRSPSLWLTVPTFPCLIDGVRPDSIEPIGRLSSPLCSQPLNKADLYGDDELSDLLGLHQALNSEGKVSGEPDGSYFDPFPEKKADKSTDAFSIPGVHDAVLRAINEIEDASLPSASPLDITTADSPDLPPPKGTFSDTSLEALRAEQAAFVEERDWAQYHTPRSLALALVGEVGEVYELLQWRGDGGAEPGLPGWSDDDRTALGDELADVLSYVMRLADVAGIDLPAAFRAKLAKNRAKYPVERARGSAEKYTAYAAEADERRGTAGARGEQTPGATEEEERPNAGEGGKVAGTNTGDLEVDSLDELFGLMEFGDSAEL